MDLSPAPTITRACCCIDVVAFFQQILLRLDAAILTAVAIFAYAGSRSCTFLDAFAVPAAAVLACLLRAIFTVPHCHARTLPSENITGTLFLAGAFEVISLVTRLLTAILAFETC